MRVFPLDFAAGRRAGFTLIELMVVIAVIGILASMILVVLGRGRESANAVRCAGNLGQIGQAIVSYAADNEGRLPGPLQEQQSNDIPGANGGSLLGILKRYLQVEGPGGEVAQAGIFTCPAWEQKDKRRSSAVFTMNFVDRMPEMENRVPWGTGGAEPVKLVNLPGWNPRPSAPTPAGLSEIWAIRDGDFAPEAGRSVHGDFRNALFYDWHVGRLNLKNEPK